MAYEKNMNYAGFWKRFAAAVIDLFIFQISSFILGMFFGVYFGMFFGMVPDDLDGLNYYSIFFNILGALMFWIYYAAFESSAKQATPGKMALGIKVTDHCCPINWR